MSVVTEHLEQRGSAFELLPHRQAYTSTDEARALGIDAGEVLKTLAVRTGFGYVLVVIPASCRLDLHLVSNVVGDGFVVRGGQRYREEERNQLLHRHTIFPAETKSLTGFTAATSTSHALPDA